MDHLVYVGIAVAVVFVMIVVYHALFHSSAAKTVQSADTPATVGHLGEVARQVVAAVQREQTTAQVAVKQVEHGVKLDAIARSVGDLHDAMAELHDKVDAQAKEPIRIHVTDAPMPGTEHKGLIVEGQMAEKGVNEPKA